MGILIKQAEGRRETCRRRLSRLYEAHVLAPRERIAELQDRVAEAEHRLERLQERLLSGDEEGASQHLKTRAKISDLQAKASREKNLLVLECCAAREAQSAFERIRVAAVPKVYGHLNSLQKEQSVALMGTFLYHLENYGKTLAIKSEALIKESVDSLCQSRDRLQKRPPAALCGRSQEREHQNECSFIEAGISAASICLDPANRSVLEQLLHQNQRTEALNSESMAALAREAEAAAGQADLDTRLASEFRLIELRLQQSALRAKNFVVRKALGYSAHLPAELSAQPLGGGTGTACTPARAEPPAEGLARLALGTPQPGQEALFATPTRMKSPAILGGTATPEELRFFQE